MEQFDETKNYKSIHLEWIKANRGFRPQRGIMPMYNTYLDEMTEMYNETIKANKTAYVYLRDDYNWSKRSRSINDEVAVLFGDKPIDNNPKFFVTFNFDEQLFNSQNVLKDLAKFMSKDWIKSLTGAFEYYTEKGHHPHLMMVISVNKYKNKILDKMKESILAKYCKSVNFIDVKKWQPFHDDYVALDKDPKKKEYLDKDVLWRIEQNLPHSIKKDN